MYVVDIEESLRTDFLIKILVFYCMLLHDCQFFFLTIICKLILKCNNDTLTPNFLKFLFSSRE